MKKTIFIAALACCFAVFSCKTTKPAGTAQTTPKTEDTKSGKPSEKAVDLSEADSLRSLAIAARDEALAVKADKAVKDEYAHANDIFNQGEKGLAEKNIAGAKEMYIQSKNEFDTVAKIAREKRELAELAYRDASAAILETRRKALENEAELRAAGIDPATAEEQE
ncbi:MAG: hypothetical protein LBG72_04410 [Spirochaetaceae bacterium]|jgi:hypothetical protein|nr:hypothetical protein [Spirochaetaceae bacterium]